MAARVRCGSSTMGSLRVSIRAPHPYRVATNHAMRPAQLRLTRSCFRTSPVRTCCIGRVACQDDATVDLLTKRASVHPYYAQFAPKPGCVPLRPLTLSDILDGSFQTIRRNPRSTLGLSAVIAVVQVSVLAIFQVVVFALLRDSQVNSSDANQLDVGQLVGVLSSVFSVIVLSAVFGAVLTGMLTQV